MILILSPAKTLDFDQPGPRDLVSKPHYAQQADKLAQQLSKYSAKELGDLMGISARLAYLNYDRYQQWDKDAGIPAAKQAILAYKGDVYNGLKAEEFTRDDLAWAQDHLFIFSGLYGVLRPLDLIMPYRLDLGTPMSGKGFKDLYDYWGDRVTLYIKEQAEKEGSGLLVNLASAEYYQALDAGQAGLKVVTPVFKEYRNGEYRFLSMFGKKARGMMARYIVERRISDIEEVKLFDMEGYAFNAPLSDDGSWVFTR